MVRVKKVFSNLIKCLMAWMQDVLRIKRIICMCTPAVCYWYWCCSRSSTAWILNGVKKCLTLPFFHLFFLHFFRYSLFFAFSSDSFTECVAHWFSLATAINLALMFSSLHCFLSFSLNKNERNIRCVQVNDKRNSIHWCTSIVHRRHSIQRKGQRQFENIKFHIKQAVKDIKDGKHWTGLH